MAKTPTILFRLLLAFFTVTISALAPGCGLKEIYISKNAPPAAIDSIPDARILHRIFLIGDAGESSPGTHEPNFEALIRSARHESEKNTIVFLGDNIYPSGMPLTERAERKAAEHFLREQIRIVNESKAKGIFIPGNHDWDRMGADGLASIQRQAEFIEKNGKPRTQFLPDPGSPGPAKIDIGEYLRLVILDTQWWMQNTDKLFYPNVSTEAAMKLAIIDSLRTIMASSGNRKVLVLGHHPLDTHGPHGGFYEWRDHLFPLRNIAKWLWLPLPVLGELYPLARSHGISDQDISNGEYEDFIQQLETIFAEHPPLAYGAGHEHALQVLQGKGDYIILVSGFGTSYHDSKLTTGANTIFAHAHPGFMRIDLIDDGRVRLSVIEPANDFGETQEVYSMWLSNHPTRSAP